MKKIIYSLIFSICILGISCENNFNDLPADYYGVDAILIDSARTMGIVNSIYLDLPDGYNRMGGNSMIAATTDEAVQGGLDSEAQNMALGVWSATKLADDAWGKSYTAIRKANDFLDSFYPIIPDNLFKSQQTIDYLVGQTHFLRAFFYFELVKRYGGVPLIKSIPEISLGNNVSRDTYDDCINFIIEECDLAASNLPNVWANATSDFGRATKGAALALKSRALLYAASPLFNDPSKTDNTVEHGAYDAAKWNKAAQAAYEVINSNDYSLYNNYNNFFTTLYPNSEIILYKTSKQNNNVERLNGPTGFTSGGGGTCPSLELADAFQMADGSSFDWSNPTHAANPFSNREPRFYSTILYNGLSWMGRQIETFEGGMDLGSVNSTKTGFYLRKFLKESAVWFGGSTGSTYHCFPLIRYGEILLNYAEAMNESYGPENAGNYGMTALSAVNLIRKRSSVPDLPSGLTKDEMRLLIQHERQIELAFEEHRHLDLRRWKIADVVLNQPVHGLKIEKAADGSLSYQRIVSQNRIFRPEMYLYPIPQNEIGRNSSLKQNSNW